MAHFEQSLFCSIVKGLFPAHFRGKNVLDIGSLNVNGTNRPLFWNCRYTGIDLAPGPNVSIVCPGHLWKAPAEYYDTIICTECGEHDEHYEKTIANAIRMLKPGGLFIYTCATTGRPEHGTKRTDPKSSPFTTDYYKNLTQADIEQAPGFAGAWKAYRFTVDREHHDLQFWGIKKGILRFRPSLIWCLTAQIQLFINHRLADLKTRFT